MERFIPPPKLIKIIKKMQYQHNTHIHTNGTEKGSSEMDPYTCDQLTSNKSAKETKWTK